MIKKELSGSNPESTKPPVKQKRGSRAAPPVNAFPKGGSSPNPGGRPAGVTHVRELARTYTTEAVEKMAQIMRTGQNERARVAAAEGLLNRAWGKPDQFVAVDVTVEHKSALVDKILDAIRGRAAGPATIEGVATPGAEPGKGPAGGKP